MPYQRHLDRPEWSFNCPKVGSWQAHLMGHGYICTVVRSSDGGGWVAVGGSKASPLGVFKTREMAARAYLDWSFTPETIELKSRYLYNWMDNPRRNVHMTEEEAQKVWDILVEECDAGSRGREQFVATVTKGETPCREYRFQGALGFGGKLYMEPRRWSVGYYSEDESAYRNLCEARANARLHDLFLEYKEAQHGQE